jgi:hypothetical protein
VNELPCLRELPVDGITGHSRAKTLLIIDETYENLLMKVRLWLKAKSGVNLLPQVIILTKNFTGRQDFHGIAGNSESQRDSTKVINLVFLAAQSCSLLMANEKLP